MTDRSGNTVLGSRFDATIEDVEELLRQKAHEFQSVYAADLSAETMDADTVSVDPDAFEESWNRVRKQI